VFHFADREERLSQGTELGYYPPQSAIMERSDYARIAFVVVLLVVLYYVFRILQPFLPALAWAAVLATAFYPAYRKLAGRIKRARLASALTCVLLTTLIVLPIILLLIEVAGESVQAYRSLESRVQSQELGGFEYVRETSVYQWVRDQAQALGLPEPNLEGAAVKVVQAISQFLVRHSSDVFSGFATFVFNFFVTIIATYYLFLGGPEIRKEMRRLSPLRHQHEERMIEKFKEIAVVTLEGGILTALLQGAAGGLIFFFFGIPSPLLWGAVMALLSLVPVIGTALVWGPVVVFYLLSGSVAKGLLLFGLCAGLVGSIDNVVKPLLIQRRAAIPTFWVFIGVLGGIGVFGFLGLVLGPLMVTVLFALVEIYKVEFRDELSEKLTP
jgi:predicted PurR-regulated permease PerM